MATEASLLLLAKAATPRAYAQVEADDATAPASHLSLALIKRGFLDGSGDPDPALVLGTNVAPTAYHAAYNITLAALDLTRTKIQEAQATPTAVKFRKEEDYLKALLKRLASQAGIPDEESPLYDTEFEAEMVEYFPDVDATDVEF